MSRPLTYREPDFKKFKRSCGIDFVRFFSKTTKRLSLPSARTNIKYLRAEGHEGMLITIHDPTVEDIRLVVTELPSAQFDQIEVFFDLTPKGRLTYAERHRLIEDARQWIISQSLPWQADGMQVATRVSKGRGHVAPLLDDEGEERRAERYETMYFGHSKSMYADPSRPNFASARLYQKITDMRAKLALNKHRCRLEVTWNAAGCNHHGLLNAESLFGFDFRLFGPYFRFVKPEVKADAIKGLHSRNPLDAALASKRREMAQNRLREVGSHVAALEPLLNVDGHHRHKAGNRMVQVSLDYLTRKYGSLPGAVAYRGEWGSW